MSRMTFRELFCVARGCADSEFEERVLWECIYPQGAWLARRIWRLHRGFFERDMELIHDAGAMTGISDVKTEISNFRYRHPSQGLLRGVLKVRVSGQLLLDLAVNLFRAVR